jgi:class 3 adenylate cyclase
MLASVLIIAISALLLIYWFRYTCLLLLRARAEQTEALASPPDVSLGMAGIREKLKGEVGLDALETLLNRDYRVLTYLLEHAAGHGLNSIEDRMLILDFRIMRCWFRLTRVAAPRQALDALSEMSMVLNVLIGKLGPQAKLQGQA